ncbi:hypothetical protein ACRAWC_01555 [Leifsonia sp. L25]|uniref:hypothetical protein n=1 Tax=Actinomycetes TaxID=1760 RepID=UPI003D69A802
MAAPADREEAYTALRIATNRLVSALLDSGNGAGLVTDIRVARAFQARLPVGDLEALRSGVTQLNAVAERVENGEVVDVSAELGSPVPLPVDVVVEYDTMRESASRLAGWLVADASTDEQAAAAAREIWDAVGAVDPRDDDAVLLARERFAKRLRDLDEPGADEAIEQWQASEIVAEAEVLIDKPREA